MTSKKAADVVDDSERIHCVHQFDDFGAERLFEVLVDFLANGSG